MLKQPALISSDLHYWFTGTKVQRKVQKIGVGGKQFMKSTPGPFASTDRVPYFSLKQLFSQQMQIWQLSSFLDTLSTFWSQPLLKPTNLTNDQPILY